MTVAEGHRGLGCYSRVPSQVDSRTSSRRQNMSLAERLSEYIRACFTGLWIQTHEDQDALAEIRGLCRQEGWQLANWDIEQGLRVAGQSADGSGATDPLAAIRALSAMAPEETESGERKGSALLVLHNFHRF